MKTILITGQTGLITRRILEQISRRFSVVLTSDDRARKEEICRIYYTKPGEASLGQLFSSYEFAAVWHISAWADMKESGHAMEELKAVFHLCTENHISQLLVVSSSLLSEEQLQEEVDLLGSARDAGTYPVLIRVPGILTDSNRNTSLGRIFSGAYNRKRKIRIPDTEDGNYEYLPMMKIVSLLEKVTLSAPEPGVYQLPGEYVISKEQLAAEVSAVSRRSRLVPEGRRISRAEGGRDVRLSRKYAYFAKDQKQLEFRRLYEEYSEDKRKRSGGILEKTRRLRSRIPGNLVKVLDIIVLFLLAEFLSRYISEFVYFKEIDVRLIYIFLIATFHGLKAGVVASVAECVVLYYQYQMLGVYGMQLFYNVENWIPFALCIVTGAVTGYFSDLKEDERAIVDRENALLREKYLFLNDMYNVSSEVRDDYRRQILTFENSYGKIYDAVQRMECDTVAEVCVQAREILAQHLDNSSVCIYQWVPEEAEARLLASSDQFDRAGREVLLPGKMGDLFEVLNEEKTYVNTQLSPGAPMYGAALVPRPAGHRQTSCAPVMVLVWDALPSQMNEYYTNQFEILCGLMNKALDRAALLECTAAEQKDRDS